MAASEKSCARPPAPPAAWIHQIRAAGGASSSTTMVMVFVLFVLFVRRRHSLYVDEYERDVDKYERITLSLI